MLLLPVAVVTAIHLACQLFTGGGPVQDVSKALLMPAVALVLAASTSAPRSRLARLVLVALGFSWLGDVVPKFAPEGQGFLTMVGFFLVAQVLYVAAFAPRWRASVVGRRPLMIVPYAAAFLTLVALCAPGAGSLLVPVVVYGLALTSMAVLSTGLGTLGGIGGAVFLLSDALIALGEFAGLQLPAHGFWVMFTYVVGQLLLVLAVGMLERDDEPLARTDESLSTPARGTA